MADDVPDNLPDNVSLMDYLEQSLRSIHKVKGLVKRGGVLEIHKSLCRRVLSQELANTEDFLITHFDKLLVRDSINDRRRIALQQLFGVIKQAESLVQQCCKSDNSTWPERALYLFAIKEDVLDITLHLRWWKNILDIMIEFALSQRPASAHMQQIELERLRYANLEFEGMSNVMELFDIMDSNTDEIQTKGIFKDQKATLDRIMEFCRGYTGERGTKEHLAHILSWNPRDYQPRYHIHIDILRNTPIYRLDTLFMDILKKCIDIQKSAVKDRKMLLLKTSHVKGSYCGESGSREHCAYLFANQVHSLLTDVEEDGIPELNEYKLKCTLGRGSSGVVKEVTWCGHDCVLKQLFNSPNNLEDLREATSLKRCSHPHIVKFCRHWVAAPGSNEHLSAQSHLVMEKMPRDLAQHIKNLKENSPSSFSPSRASSSPPSSTVVPFSECVAVDIMLQLAKTMWYMHSKDVVHRDLKPGNVLVRPLSEVPELYDQGYVQVKLGDFGLVREHMPSSNSQLPKSNRGGSIEGGRSLYRAPELSSPNSTVDQKLTAGEEKVVEIKHPQKVDVWSFGMMSSEILSGERPFVKVHKKSSLLVELWNGARPRIPDQCPDYLKFCIESCWKYDPMDRPTFSDLWRMLRIAKLRSLDLLRFNYDWFMYMDREDRYVGLHLRPPPSQLEKSSDAVTRFSTSNSVKKNFSVLMSVFLKFTIFGGPSRQLIPVQSRDIHQEMSPHKKPFGNLTNRVWPRERRSDWKLDVIFFEGNVGARKALSCRDTWILRYNPKVFWPQHWLPGDVDKDIRVLVLEYCISEKGLEGLVSDIKKFLIFSDRWNQKGTWKRPIVLVGHSLGCTVIEALVMNLDQNARQLSEGSPSDYDKKKAETSRAFLSSLRGCFFYGYPSYGFVQNHSFLTEVFGGLSYSDELFEVEFWEGSQKLQKRSSEFLSWARTQNPPINLMALAEGNPTRRIFVVQRPALSDPKPYDLKLEHSLMLLSSNHIEICKPVHREQTCYRELVNFLRKEVTTEQLEG